MVRLQVERGRETVERRPSPKFRPQSLRVVPKLTGFDKIFLRVFLLGISPSVAVLPLSQMQRNTTPATLREEVDRVSPYPANSRTTECKFGCSASVFILSKNRVAKNCLFAYLALAADDVFISG